MFAPAGGKRLVCFIDDLNMPAKSKFGFIPPLELLKLWVDNGFWCVPWHAGWDLGLQRGAAARPQGLLF